MPFSNDPYNDPNRFARQAAQRASEEAQRASRRAMEQSQKAAAQAAENSRRVAEQNRQTMLRDQQARQQRESASRLRQSDTQSDYSAPASSEETKRGGSKGFLLLVLIIGVLAVLGSRALGWV